MTKLKAFMAAVSRRSFLPTLNVHLGFKRAWHSWTSLADRKDELCSEEDELCAHFMNVAPSGLVLVIVCMWVSSITYSSCTHMFQEETGTVMIIITVMTWALRDSLGSEFHFFFFLLMSNFTVNIPKPSMSGSLKAELCSVFVAERRRGNRGWCSVIYSFCLGVNTSSVYDIVKEFLWH